MSKREDLPKEALIALAQKTLLGLVPASRDVIPPGYIEELRKHVKFSKDDVQFRIVPQPKLGYGIVRCLEKGCEDAKIVLGPRTGVYGGGKEEGIGSLSAYRVHVQDHPTHKVSRLERVKDESKSYANSLVSSAASSPIPTRSSSVSAHANISRKPSKSSLLSAMADRVGGSASSSIVKVPRARPSRPVFKAEPYDSSLHNSSPSSIIPRKRSSMGEGTDITIPSSSPQPSPSNFKRAKLEGRDTKLQAAQAESAPKPLGTVNPNAPRPLNSSVSRTTGSSTHGAAESPLAATNELIETKQIQLAHHQKKARKSAYDRRRISNLEAEIRAHKATRTRYELALQTTAAAAPSSGATQPASAGMSNAKRSTFDIKPLGGANPPSVAAGYNAYLPPVLPPTASGSNVQLPAMPNALPGIDFPAIGLPNYGDTMEYSSDEESYGARFRRHLPYRGPIADPGDIDKFLIEAGNSEAFDGNESVDKALAKLDLTKLGERIPMMNIPLMPHQVIGVAWMLEHERGPHKGGIMADEMGLGKTVQMIATMVKHRSDDPAVKSTLICAPVALLDQWKLEIETKTDEVFKCLVYHGPNKPRAIKELQKYDVVLTTFQTLALEWPDGRVEEKKKKQNKKNKGGSDDFIEDDSDTDKKAKKKGLLLRMSWFRIVLDEAQNIRNRNTRISLAVTNLTAEHRWCLTGTPVTNALADCYGFLRFLEIRPWYDWSDFNSHIARIEKKRPDLASSRLQAILNSCLIRRKKDSVLDGKRLIELPPKEVKLRQLAFSQEERDIYNAIEKQSQTTFNRYLRAGTVLKNYAHVLVLLLRLRQLCNHPSLIQEGGDAFFLPGDDETVKHEVQTELQRAEVLVSKEFVLNMKRKLKEVVLERIAAEKASADAAIEEDECPICFDNVSSPLLTRCGHQFCCDCIEAVLNQPAVGGGNQPRYAMSERPCPTCREPVTREMLFQRSAFEPTDADLELKDSGSTPIVVDDSDKDGLPIAADLFPAAKQDKPVVKGKAKAKSKKRFTKRLPTSDEEYEDDSDDSDISDFIVQSDEDEEEKDACRELRKRLGRKTKRIALDSDEDVDMDDGEELLPPTVVAKRTANKKGNMMQRFLPSTKMKEMMALLKEWAEAEETKNEKTMILSQWTSCLDLVADYLEENGFTFVRYDGRLSRLARDEAVRTFMAQGRARIMLMSLKCGGVGLNLTRASRVISLDLGWSPAVENQAFDRVHRLGQTRPVTVERLVIEDTVEARILALQERKQNLADGSLGEGNGKKLGRLSVKDLANLFGLSVRGHAL